MSKIVQVMQGAGLDEKDARVYLALIELREGLPSDIAKRSGIKRPTVYLSLEELLERGLVSRVRRGRRTYYRALDTSLLLEDALHRYQALEKAMPDLAKLAAGKKLIPEMGLFEGREGIKRIVEDSLTARGEIMVWGDVSQRIRILGDYFPEYLRRRKERGIRIKAIFTYDQLALERHRRDKEELRECYLIPKNEYPFGNEVLIYNDKTAIISYEDRVGATIQSQSLADMQRSMFRFAFEYAKVVHAKLLRGKK